nr:hypothetical protein CFP56_16616 [Quercus suber]
MSSSSPHPKDSVSAENEKITAGLQSTSLAVLEATQRNKRPLAATQSLLQAALVDSHVVFVPRLLRCDDALNQLSDATCSRRPVPFSKLRKIAPYVRPEARLAGYPAAAVVFSFVQNADSRHEARPSIVTCHQHISCTRAQAASASRTPTQVSSRTFSLCHHESDAARCSLETSKTFRGACFSPFVRAYAPGLASYGISEASFLTFVDGLNEAFVAHPIYQGLNIVGTIMSLIPVVKGMQLAGTGIALGAAGASYASSYLQTKAYLKAMNQTLFEPLRLHVEMLTTPEMMEKVVGGETRLELPPLEFLGEHEEAEIAGQIVKMSVNDPRIRRMKALENFVMPLDFDVPEVATPNSMLKRMGNSQAKRLAKKQEAKMLKKYHKGKKKFDEESAEAENRTKQGEDGVAKAEIELAKEHKKLESDLTQDQVMGDERVKDRIVEKHDRQVEKMTKEIEKKRRENDKEVHKHKERAEKGRSKVAKDEEKIANKIRWIVISTWGPDVDEHGEDACQLPSGSEGQLNQRSAASIMIRWRHCLAPACELRCVVPSHMYTALGEYRANGTRYEVAGAMRQGAPKRKVEGADKEAFLQADEGKNVGLMCGYNCNWDRTVLDSHAYTERKGETTRMSFNHSVAAAVHTVFARLFGPQLCALGMGRCCKLAASVWGRPVAPHRRRR